MTPDAIALLGFSVALLVFVARPAAEWLGHRRRSGIDQLGDQLVLLPIFNFTYTENQGISLGLLNATNPVGRWMLVALTAAIAVGVAVWIGREKNRIDQVALGHGARRSARQHPRPRAATAMSSTSPTFTSATSGPFWYSMSAMRRLALPS